MRFGRTKDPRGELSIIDARARMTAPTMCERTASARLSLGRSPQRPIGYCCCQFLRRHGEGCLDACCSRHERSIVTDLHLHRRGHFGPACESAFLIGTISILDRLIQMSTTRMTL